MKKIIVKSLILISILFLNTSADGFAKDMQEAVVQEQEASVAETKNEELENASEVQNETVDEDKKDIPDIQDEILETELMEQESEETETGEVSLYESPGTKSGRWVLNETGWWFEYGDGTWPASTIVEINGVRYGFNDSGYMVTGWYFDGRDWYYFNPDGSMYNGWLLLGNIWYYLDCSDAECPGRMISGCEQEIDGARYLFAADGSMQVGWVLRPEGWYYVDGNGVICTGWLFLGGVWYYLDASHEKYPGLMAESEWIEVNGAWYYLTEGGAMATNWLLLEEGWYYLGTDGAEKSGWQYVNGAWYYLDGNNAEHMGLMVSDGWHAIGENYYYLTKSGAMATGWLLLEEGWYYLGTDGAMRTGWQQIGDSRYYFYQENDPNDGIQGVMAANKTIDGWEILESGVAVHEFQCKVEEIKKYITTPYLYGGTTPSGWDCSGFTQWALNYLGGVTIPRTAVLQAAGGINVGKDDMSLWKPGDVLVYSSGNSYTHVALYLGDGMLMHALNYKYGTLIQGVDYYEQWDSGNELALVRRYLY